MLGFYPTADPESLVVSRVVVGREPDRFTGIGWLQWHSDRPAGFYANGSDAWTNFSLDEMKQCVEKLDEILARRKADLERLIQQIGLDPSTTL
jgi:hypothetical protein